ncbi:flagellar basal body-associated FliL family protein [Thiomicrorhabdus arctica]|uniref:flagellar basal body-associated FliL family protein n=1 Tax=Thiomicrorhabdus arctica TaxID=131540 RepID=UPI00037FF2EB|nr:flagellar basal body-associated FliL family protein [Thiomicrorhabdus arctica]
MSKEEVIEEGQEGKKSGGKGLIIVLLVVVILLLVGMGIMAFLLMSGSHDKDTKTDTSEMHAPAEHGDEASGEDASVNSHAKSYSPKYKQFEPPAPEAAPSYFIMDKFVVNFDGAGKAKFLAVDLQFMSYYAQVVGADGEMEHLRPILKNDIQRLLRNQHFTDLDKPDGPDHLRAEILEVARKVLEKHNIYPDLIEDVYMTRFVMQ